MKQLGEHENKAVIAIAVLAHCGVLHLSLLSDCIKKLPRVVWTGH